MRALPGQTLLHVPAQFRERAAIAMASSLEQLVDGSLLELGRSKLLFSVPPKGVHQRTELGERFRLWGEGQFEALLVRVEEQARERAAARGLARRIDALEAKLAALESRSTRSRFVIAMSPSIDFTPSPTDPAFTIA